MINLNWQLQIPFPNEEYVRAPANLRRGRPFTYVDRDQEASAQMLVKREAPGFSVPIHVWNILLYCLIIQSEPDTIIIVDLWETSNRAEPCPPVTANTPLARASEAAEPIALIRSTNQLDL